MTLLPRHLQAQRQRRHLIARIRRRPAVDAVQHRCQTSDAGARVDDAAAPQGLLLDHWELHTKLHCEIDCELHSALQQTLFPWSSLQHAPIHSQAEQQQGKDQQEMSAAQAACADPNGSRLDG